MILQSIVTPKVLLAVLLICASGAGILTVIARRKYAYTPEREEELQKRLDNEAQDGKE